MTTSLTTALRRGLLPLVLLVAALPLTGHAGLSTPPPYMAYQGYLTDGNGNPLGATNTGPKNYSVVFRLWNVQTGGTVGGANELYAEAQTVTLNNGYYSVLLGQGTPYAAEPGPSSLTLASLFTAGSSTSLYVETMILGIGSGGANLTLSPRLQLLSAPYAFLAANAANAAFATNAGGLVSPLNAAAVTVNSIGNVGIGTASPVNALTVGGNANVTGAFQAGATLVTSLTNTGTANIGGSTSIGGTLSAGATLVTSLTNTGSANIGGNTSVGGSLSAGATTVNGTLSAGSTMVNGTLNAGSTTVSSLTNNGNESIAGSLGIGTNTPNAQTTIAGNFTSNLGIGMTLIGLNNGGSFLSLDQAGLSAWGIGTLAGQTRLSFFNNRYPASAGAEVMSILGNNYVGIGTNNPAQALEVNGSAQVDGNVYAGIGHVVSSTGLGLFLEAASDIYFRHDITNGNIVSYTELMHITTNGYVGIGTTTPKCALDVETSNSVTTAAGYGYLNDAGQVGSVGVGSRGFSIWAVGNVAAFEFDAVSDGRVKEIVARSDTQNDLAVVRKLQITDYRKIDRAEFGGRLEKGVIAQEVEKLIPQAISTTTDFVPDVYAMAKSLVCTNQMLLVTLEKPHGLVAGDVVKLITDTGELKTVVTAVPAPQQFAVAQPAQATGRLFVFGKQVADFRTVNYDRLFTTGLGAIQELAKRTDELQAQQARVADLTSELAEVKKQVAVQQTQMADLKKMVLQLAEAAKNSKMTASAAETAAPTLTSLAH